jgi:hypothetical protein
MDLTTTEKLLIAMAYDQYGENKLEQIHRYLKCNNLDLNKSEIELIFINLKEESKVNGYSNVLEYCEDKRYSKGIELYFLYKNMLIDVLEDREVDWELSSSEEESPIINKVINKSNIKIIKKKEVTKPLNLMSLGNLENVKIQNENQMQIEPKFINKAIPKGLKLEPSSSFKEKKRFYYKLTEEEKLIDDYFDILDERADLRTNKVKRDPNPWYSKYPAAKTVFKNNEDTKNVIEEQTEFDLILKKISSLKRQDKDKSLWKPEIKILLEYAIKLIGHKEDFKEIIEKIETSSLSQIVVLILLILQDLIIDGEEREEVGMIKKNVSLFYDFYKK